MAYDATGFDTQFISSKRSLHFYSTNDPELTVIADDYFLPEYKKLNVGDSIMVAGDLDGTPVALHLIVKASSSATVTVAVNGNG